MKKMLLLLLGGIVLMSTVTGCSTTNSDLNRTEVQELFADFTNMFPTENLDTLYDKSGNTANLEPDDLGSWVISSYTYSEESGIKERIGIRLVFNRNLRINKGHFYVETSNDGEKTNDEYLVDYTSEGLKLIDQNGNEKIAKRLEEFEMLFSFVNLDTPYLDSLDIISSSYNKEVPLYDIVYKLLPNDENIKMISQLYPNLALDSNNLTLSFEGTTIPWDTNGTLSLEIDFDNNSKNYFTANLSYSRSEKFTDLFDMN